MESGQALVNFWAYSVIGNHPKACSLIVLLAIDGKIPIYLEQKSRCFQPKEVGVAWSQRQNLVRKWPFPFGDFQSLSVFWNRKCKCFFFVPMANIFLASKHPQVYLNGHKRWWTKKISRNIGQRQNNCRFLWMYYFDERLVSFQYHTFSCPCQTCIRDHMLLIQGRWLHENRTWKSETFSCL